MIFSFTESRRKRLKQSPFPSHWLHALDRRVPLYNRLGAEDQEELRGHVSVFVAEKNFEGVRGLILTDEIMVTIAANAGILLLHRETDYFPGLSSIIVYPGEFVAPFSDADEAGIVTEGEDIRSGESWTEGSLVLSWEDVLLSEREGYEGYNVILHEFAHQLDAEYGITVGEPLLGKRRGRWQGVLEEEYLRHRQEVENGENTLLDPYGAENAAEFFAVATECFFCRPNRMKREVPDLYDEFRRIYRQDPSGWPGYAPD